MKSSESIICSVASDSATPWMVCCQVSMELSRQEYRSGLSFPSSGDLPNPAIESTPPVLWADSLPSEPPANSGDTRDLGWIPGSGRSPGEGNGNPIQCSCLENTRDRGAWWATVHEVAKSETGLSMHTLHHRKFIQIYTLHLYL